MSTVKAAFNDWLEVVSEPEREYREDVQIGLRVDSQVAAGLDALAKLLGSSRTAVARQIVSAGIHDALDVAGLAYCFGPGVGYTVVPAKNDCPDGTFRVAAPFTPEASEVSE
jgi:hypothetical protein